MLLRGVLGIDVYYFLRLTLKHVNFIFFTSTGKFELLDGHGAPLNTFPYTILHMNKIMALLFGILLVSSFSFATRCLDDWNCDSNEVCVLRDCFVPNECVALEDCGPTESCVKGVCVSMSCFVTSECPTDQICNEGKCIPKECMEDSDCLDSQECLNYECYDVQKEVAMQPKEEPKPSEVTSSTSPAACVSAVADDCPVLSCPNKTCAAIPEPGLLESYVLPFLFVALILGLFLGFSASKIISDNENGSSNEKKEDKRKPGEESGETDFDDEGSYRYI